MPSAKLTGLVSLAGAQVPTDLAYIVDVSAGIAGSKSSTLDDLFAIITKNITDGAVRFQGFAAPAVSGAAQGSIYFDSATNRLLFSENAGAYVRVGNVTGPAASTDEALARFDLATGRLLQNSSITLSDAGAFAFPDDVRQTFNPGATVAGLNVGSVAVDPSTPINGDLWYDSTGNLLRARINGATVSLGATTSPGGLNTEVQYNNAGAFGGVSGFTSDGTNVTAGDGNLRATSPLITTGIDDANGNTIIGLSPVAVAVNQITVANAAAGGHPVISATGAGTDINLTFSPKGAGVNVFTKNLLMDVGSGALDNLIYVDSLTSGAVNASFGFFVAGVGSQQSSDGPYFLGRGLTFTAVANQRGNMVFAAGSPAAPGQAEGAIVFFTNSPEDMRVRIGRSGSGLAALAVIQSNTGEIGLTVNNPNASTVAIASFQVNSVPFVVIDSSANSYFGNGITNAAPANYILNATGGSGTDIAGANLDLAGGKGTGNAIPGLVAVRYPLIGATGTTLQSLSATRFPVQTNFYLNYSTTTTVANTTTETSLLGAADQGTDTIEAGLARVGQTFRFSFTGTVQTTGSPVLTIRLKLGGSSGTTIQTWTKAITGGAAAWELIVYGVITAIGAAGNISIQSAIFQFTPAGVEGIGSGKQSTVIDFTANQQWALTAQWGTADAANSITYQFGNIDIVR